VVGLEADRSLRGLAPPHPLFGSLDAWSQQLRIRCVSGSLMASMMVLSSSVPEPVHFEPDLFARAWATSRTRRGNLFQTTPMGCIRVFMTFSCSSVVIRFSR